MFCRIPPLSAPINFTKLSVGVPGFEPELLTPEASVLPLYYTPINFGAERKGCANTLISLYQLSALGNFTPLEANAERRDPALAYVFVTKYLFSWQYHKVFCL